LQWRDKALRELTKKIRHTIIFGALLIFSIGTTNQAFSIENINRYRANYKAALLADAESGRILHHDRMHNKIFPASLVKMMVALITLEEINSGRISLQDKVQISRWASKIGGHQVYLKQGEIFTLRELMKATVISSANDAAVAVAEHVFGQVKFFLKKMNERAKELGMKKTRYFSVHGLPPGRGQKLDVSSAFDLFLLAKELLKHRLYLSWSSTRLDTFRNGTFQLLNTNHRLMLNYIGMDGMKTGYHRRAGFNLVSTAKRKGQRYLVIVLGAKNSLLRRKATRYLLDYGFKNYLKYELNKKGETVPYLVGVENGELEGVSLQTTEKVIVLMSQEEYKRLEKFPHIPQFVKAPIKFQQITGYLEYWLDGKLLRQVKLQTEKGVQVQNPFSGLTGMLTDLSGNN